MSEVEAFKRDLEAQGMSPELAAIVAEGAYAEPYDETALRESVRAWCRKVESDESQ